ncbi:nitroreductase [Rubripirellula amarantea]|nr:nitroreductase [Rubripirellula amarantea]
MNADPITAVIRCRRTVKPAMFSDQAVDDAILREMLENANWAPTHGMTEPWRFFVFTGPARLRLADFLASTYKELTTPDNFKQSKYEGIRQSATLAPVVIAVGMKRQEIEKISELDEIMAVACAVQNLHLTAAAHGLGGFWSTNIAATSEAMRNFVGLGPKDQALGLFYVGHPQSDWPTSKRGSIDEKVQWISE